MRMGMATDTPRILFIDSYDSFTHNLAALCRQAIPGSQIHLIKNDAIGIDQLLPYINLFTAVIIGPGPGSPDNSKDIGIVRDLWHLDQAHLLPIFGVCLGLQSLAIEHGASLHQLSVVKHGQISRIQHTGSDLFKGVGEVEAVRYHSLHIKNHMDSDIEELAWAEDGEENGKVVMAVKHKTKPFWAVQYHPESVKTSGGGVEIMRNFRRLARNWSRVHRSENRTWNATAAALFGPSWPSLCVSITTTPSSRPTIDGLPRKVITKVLHLPALVSTMVAELFGAANGSNPMVLLDSAAQPGRYSIIGSLASSSCRITYHLDDDFVLLSHDGGHHREFLNGQPIWAWVATFMETRRAYEGRKEIPFWGGLIGYLSYELGCTTLDSTHASTSNGNRTHPDVNLVFVERSVVIDHQTGKVYVQSIIPKDESWIKKTANTLTSKARVACTDNPPPPFSQATISLPNREGYISRINQCKENLNAGNSYELCLTAQTKITISKPTYTPKSSSSWERYKCLRKRNPAPYSAYLRLHPSTVLCSSPERFLSFSRPPTQTFQLRPIKGTLRKSPTITRADAERSLAGSVKEVAENLMIVDLIRHDLHGIVGENVSVKQFCGIEEYETVWQMVSVIEGKYSSPKSMGSETREPNNAGWEVLRHCLPPGSMTGAPKKRSVEILKELEDGPRGIYSGVLGYWDVGGGGDWSVIIRSCFKYDPSVSNETKEAGEVIEEWTVGAGGAITALSDPQAEWDEMVLKLKSVLSVFGDDRAT